jgi:hypothetical protein
MGAGASGAVAETGANAFGRDGRHGGRMAFVVRRSGGGRPDHGGLPSSVVDTGYLFDSNGCDRCWLVVRVCSHFECPVSFCTFLAILPHRACVCRSLTIQRLNLSVSLFASLLLNILIYASLCVFASLREAFRVFA